ncbi:MAG: hypothetical protein J3R72DRAFT_382580, partial [Linnemannia gamsii]
SEFSFPLLFLPSHFPFSLFSSPHSSISFFLSPHPLHSPSYPSTARTLHTLIHLYIHTTSLLFTHSNPYPILTFTPTPPLFVNIHLPLPSFSYLLRQSSTALEGRSSFFLVDLPCTPTLPSSRPRATCFPLSTFSASLVISNNSFCRFVTPFLQPTLFL